MHLKVNTACKSDRTPFMCLTDFLLGLKTDTLEMKVKERTHSNWRQMAMNGLTVAKMINCCQLFFAGMFLRNAIE